MAQTLRAESARRLDAGTLALSCAIGCLLVWLDVVFRMDVANIVSSTDKLPFPRLDSSWLAALGAAIVVSVAMAVLWKKIGWSFDGEGVEAAASALVAQRRQAIANALGAAFMAVGSATFLFSKDNPGLALAAALVAGVGIPLSLGALMPLAMRYDGRGDLFVALYSVVASVVVALVLLATKNVAALLPILPVACGICTHLATAKDNVRKPKPQHNANGDAGAVSPLKVQAAVVFVSSFAAFGILGTIGEPAGSALRSNMLVLFMMASVTEIALLVLAMTLFRRFQLHQMLAIVLATAVACAPILHLVGLNEACVVLLKLTMLCTYTLVLLLFARAWRIGGGGSTRARRACFAMLAAIMAFMIAGLEVGDAARQAEHFDATAFALASTLFLYLMFIAMTVVQQRSKIVHVIAGSVRNEADMAFLRADAIKTNHPDLTAREFDVLLLLLQNYSAARMAEELVISENTVKTHVRHIYEKIGVESKQQLLAYARKVSPLEEENGNRD